MCLRYEKIICYDWIIQRLLELFVCTDFIFIVILTSSTIYFCSIFRYLLAIINIYTHTFKYLSINIYKFKYLYFWRNSQIHIFVSVCCVCWGQLNVCLSKSYKAHSTEHWAASTSASPALTFSSESGFRELRIVYISTKKEFNLKPQACQEMCI